MPTLPTSNLTTGHISHHEALHAAAAGGLPPDVNVGETGHTAHHASLKTWYDNATGGNLPTYTGYDSTHRTIHEMLHTHAWTAGGYEQAAPTGDLTNWTLVKVEDFNTDATLGQFGTVYGSEWTGYDGAEDTSRNLGRPVGQRGVYDTTQTVTVHDSVLDIHLHYDGSFWCAALEPIGWTGQTYGRYAARFRAEGTSNLTGYKTAWLLWPASGQWVEGEIDFPEGDLNGTIHGFSHQVDGDPNINAYSVSTSETYDDWHVAVIEWRPGSLTFIMDGVTLGSTTDSSAIPYTPMVWVLQTETWLSATAPPTTSEGNVYIDWLAQWSYTP